EIMLDKQKREPPPPSARADVPADLDELTVALLRFDPRARPSGSQVLSRLGVSDTPRVSASDNLSLPFVGRADELGELRAAFARTRAGTCATVLVQGESGVGKSALVRRF